MSAVKKTTRNTTGRRAVNFAFEDAPGKEVFLAGSFNNWQMTTRMKDKNQSGSYTCRLLLEPGEYQYKFVVNGEWRLDGLNGCFAPNGFGELNSLLKVEPK
jgi:1,4-alpha-glucan branching enzyme